MTISWDAPALHAEVIQLQGRIAELLADVAARDYLIEQLWECGAGAGDPLLLDAYQAIVGEVSGDG